MKFHFHTLIPPKYLFNRIQYVCDWICFFPWYVAVHLFISSYFCKKKIKRLKSPLHSNHKHCVLYGVLWEQAFIPYYTCTSEQQRVSLSSGFSLQLCSTDLILYLCMCLYAHTRYLSVFLLSVLICMPSLFVTCSTTAPCRLNSRVSHAISLRLAFIYCTLFFSLLNLVSFSPVTYTESECSTVKMYLLIYFITHILLQLWMKIYVPVSVKSNVHMHSISSELPKIKKCLAWWT